MNISVAPTQGRVAFEGPILSHSLGLDRFVRIYLPPSYEHNSQRHFPVLYVHDGQNAFSTVGDHVAFGWGNWQLDKTVDALVAAGKMQEILMVAIDCSAQRYLEYRGPAYQYTNSELSRLKRRPPAAGDNRRYDAYRRFLLKELKPLIDREYRTLPGARHTGVLGSSMGGICSLALAWEHPRVFGLAASLSGAFQVERRNLLLHVLRKYQGRRKSFRIYLDSGVVDYSGSDDGLKVTQAVAGELRRIGWRDDVDLVHYVDAQPLSLEELQRSGLPHWKWGEALTSQHNEFYWRIRAWRALTFLYPP